jgi:RND family efflux transporter MFP subunit
MSASPYRQLALGLSGVAILLTVSTGGCRQSRKQAAPPLPPATVMVSQPVVRDITEYLETTGSISALESVVVQARVKGFLDSMHFTPEQKIKKDDLLFVIDPRPFEVALEQAKGQLQLRQAEARFAEYDLSRMTKLQAQDAAAEREERQSRAKMEEAQASVVIAQSAVDEANLNLNFAHVKAPIAGRISRNLVDIGNLINPGQDQLATITNDDSVYAYFNVSEQDVLRLSRIYGDTRRKAVTEPGKTPPATIPVHLALMDEDDYPHAGSVDYVAPTLDASTGTLSIRGIFPNPIGFLRAGYFARIRIPLGKPKPALLVAEQALGMDQGQYYLLVVNNKNKVEYRRVRTGLLDKGLRVIEEGLGENDHVIVIGLQRVRPGAEVKPEIIPMDSVAQATRRPATKPESDSTAPKKTTH